MFKRALMIGVAGVSMALMRGGDAHAHYVNIGGYVRYHSLGCGTLLRQVPNPAQHPALFRCTANISVVEVLCQNPSGHDVNPGRAAIQISLVGQTEIEPADVNKKRGTAAVEAEIPDEALLNPDYCVNPNWIPQVALAISLHAMLETFECNGPDNDPCSILEPASFTELECDLPSQYNVLNLPPLDTPYACTVLGTGH